MMLRPVNSNLPPVDSATAGSLLRGNELSRLERSVLLAHVMNRSRESVLAHPEMALSEGEIARYLNLLQRRLAGEPIAYLVGRREFYGLDLRVTSDVLIPRPETELLVEAALQRLPDNESGHVLDLGTGSGAIALAIAKHRPLLQIEAVDVADSALQLAAANGGALCIPNVSFHRSDWYSSCKRDYYNVIASNPPYIPAADLHLSQGDLRFEPRPALTPGAEGLEAIRDIIAGAVLRLLPGGWLLFEHGYDQAEACRGLMRAAGFAEVATLRDLAGIERVCEGRMSAVAVAPNR